MDRGVRDGLNCDLVVKGGFLAQSGRADCGRDALFNREADVATKGEPRLVARLGRPP